MGPYIAHNLRYIVTDVPGFEKIQAALEDEERKIQEWEASCGGSGVNSAGSSVARSLSGLEEFATPQRPVFKAITRATSGRKAGFRPDMPYNGANKLAFDKHFAKHGVVIKKIKAPMPRPVPPKAPSSGRQKRKSKDKGVAQKSKKKKVERRTVRKARRVTKRKTKTKRVKRRTYYRKRVRSRSRSRYRARKPRWRSKKRKAKRATRRRKSRKAK